MAWEQIDEKERQALIRAARERLQQRPVVWRPEPGEEKIAEVVRIVEIDTEIGKSKFIHLRDVSDGMLYSVPAHTVLLNHCYVSGVYLIRYQGKRKGKKRGEYHEWVVEPVYVTGEPTGLSTE